MNTNETRPEPMNRADGSAIMIDPSTLLAYAGRPAPFERSTAPFWDDEWISKSLLEAHLDPKDDAASRKPETIEASVRWIAEGLSLPPGARILDLGCGPGLYVEKLAERGFRMTGIDFSRRSIAYAESRARERGLEIEYRRANYLEEELGEGFDLAIMIYCDIGVLSERERSILFRKTARALKPGGRFLFDVCTQKNFASEPDDRTSWYRSESGFWRPRTHVVLERHLAYPEANARLSLYVVLDDSGRLEAYRIWDQIYEPDMLVREIESNGFRDVEIRGDVTGKPYADDSRTICAIATVAP